MTEPNLEGAQPTLAPSAGGVDLAIVVLSMNEAHWLRALLPTIEASTAGLRVDVVVADVESTDDTAAVVEACPIARRVPTKNGGFAHANNVALLTVDARYVLFLNADTEIQGGTFAGLIDLLDRRPEIGMLGVRQIDGDGVLFPTMRRFAGVRRVLAQALWSERLAPHLGMRVLDMALYETETACDWTIGSFMLTRAEALTSTGSLDERFFFTAEEQDLCLRMRQAGWEIVHSPAMTIVHHVGKRGASPKIEAQMAFCELQYADKHFSRVRAALYRCALAVNYGIRVIPGLASADRRRGSMRALRIVLGKDPAPFMAPPASALPAGTRDAAREGRAI